MWSDTVAKRKPPQYGYTLKEILAPLLIVVAVALVALAVTKRW